MKNKYEIRGEVTAIFLKRKDGTVLETIIDTENLQLAKSFRYTWYARLNPNNNSYYVVGVDSSNGRYKRKTIQFHRWLLKPKDNMVVDHINHDTLDNRNRNIRIVTVAENNKNKKPGSKITSGIRGVYWYSRQGKWTASIRIDKKLYFIGYFNNKFEAKKELDKFKDTLK